MIRNENDAQLQRDAPSRNELNDHQAFPEPDDERSVHSTTILSVVFDRIKRFRLLCGTIVNHDKVQRFIVLLIAFNAIMLGVATVDFADPSVEIALEYIDLACLIIFTIELALQFIYLGHQLFLDGWLIFDLIIILASWSLPSVQIVRAFRIFRTLRLVTRIKMMKNLVLAVFSVIPRMIAIGMLLLLIFYVFAVMMTQLFGDLFGLGKTEEDYFGNLTKSLFTLFQLMTLDDWAGVANQVTAVYNWAWVPFLTFVTITGFVVVNLIIAVICDAVSTLDDAVKAKIHGSFDEDESMNASSVSMREQLEILEDMVEELTCSQEEIMRLLGRLRLAPNNGSAIYDHEMKKSE